MTFLNVKFSIMMKTKTNQLKFGLCRWDLVRKSHLMNQTAVKNHFWGVWFDDHLLMWNYWFINPTTVAGHFISGANWAEIYSLSSYLSFGTHKHICLESSRHLRFYNVFFRLVEHDSSTNSKQRDILSLFLYTLVFWLINQMLLFTLCYSEFRFT